MSILGTIVGSLSSIGAGNVVSNVAMKFVPANAGKFGKALYVLGVVGLSGAAGEVASGYMERKIDDAVEAVKDIRKIVNASKNVDAAFANIAAGPEDETADVEHDENWWDHIDVVESEAIKS